MGVALMVAVMCAPFLAIPAAIGYAIHRHRTREERAKWAEIEREQAERREAHEERMRELYPDYDRWMEELNLK